MKALTYGRFRGLDGNAALFDLATGPAAAPLATLRIAILERDIGRVTLQRPGGYRLDRGWAIAPDRAEPPFEGRPRDDLSGFAKPKLSASEAGGIVTLTAEGLSAACNSIRSASPGTATARKNRSCATGRPRPI